MIETVKLYPGDNLAIDPGNIGAGWVIWREDDTKLGGLHLREHGRDKNVDIRKFMAKQAKVAKTCHLQIEAPKPRGMPTAAEEMEMLIQIGRFLQMWRGGWTYVFRQPVKIHLCGSVKAKDGNVAQAIKDRFGGDSVAVGGKKCNKCKGNRTVGRLHCPKCKRASRTKNDCEHCSCGTDKSVFRKKRCAECLGKGFETMSGPLHGVAEHEWQALGLALYWMDTGGEAVHQIAGQQNIQGQKKKWAKKPKTSQGVPDA
jgi:hypothetical protein